MSMSVQNNLQGMNSYRNMTMERKKKEEEDEKLSSGYQINSAADDAAGLAVSEKMRNQITTNKAAMTNAKMAQNMVNVGEAAMQGVNDMINRATELAASGSNGTYTDGDRAAMNAELGQLVEEINRVAAATNYNGISLLDGSISVSSGESLDFAVDGDGFNLSVNLDGVSTAVNLDVNELDMTTLEQSQEIMAVLEEFVTKITSQRADLGATSNRLDYTYSNLSNMTQNLQSAESLIRDTDMAKSATESNQRSVNYQMASNTFQKAEEDKNQLLNILGS